jgi:hypothetical protein
LWCARDAVLVRTHDQTYRAHLWTCVNMCKKGAVPGHQCRAWMLSINFTSFKPSLFSCGKMMDSRIWSGVSQSDFHFPCPRHWWFEILYRSRFWAEHDLRGKGNPCRV